MILWYLPRLGRQLPTAKKTATKCQYFIIRPWLSCACALFLQSTERAHTGRLNDRILILSIDKQIDNLPFQTYDDTETCEEVIQSSEATYLARYY